MRFHVDVASRSNDTAAYETEAGSVVVPGFTGCCEPQLPKSMFVVGVIAPVVDVIETQMLRPLVASVSRTSQFACPVCVARLNKMRCS